jgi:hypothetical protein
MFRVDVEDQDGLGDLIALMAKQVQAEYRFRITLETECERLAGSVSKLVGSPLLVDPELDERSGLGFGLLGIRGINPAASEEGEGVLLLGEDVAAPAVDAPEHKNGKAALTGTCRYCGKAIAERRVICQGAECKRRADQEKDYGQCEFCDAPRLTRSKTCGGEECGKKLAKKHQLAYQARKEAEAAKAVEATEAAPVAEVAKSESPFPDVTATEPVYEVEYPDQTLRLKFQDLMAQNQAGEIPDGTRVRAQPSGRW